MADSCKAKHMRFQKDTNLCGNDLNVSNKKCYFIVSPVTGEKQYVMRIIWFL